MISNREKKVFLLKSETRMPILATFLQHGMRSPNHNIQIRKRNKRNPNWKGRSKTVIVCR